MVNIPESLFTVIISHVNRVGRNGYRVNNVKIIYPETATGDISYQLIYGHPRTAAEDNG